MRNSPGFLREAARAGTPSPRARGFTLVEVAVAGFILAVTSLGVAVTLAQAGRLEAAPREEMAVRSAIQTGKRLGMVSMEQARKELEKRVAL
jgi:type II secretory pathway component PulJ